MYNPQLETFIRAADAGSFNKAAEELFITPPAVIKQITSLETNLDIKLFVRSPRGLTLTEAGKSLYKDAKYITSTARNPWCAPGMQPRKGIGSSASAFHP